MPSIDKGRPERRVAEGEKRRVRSNGGRKGGQQTSVQRREAIKSSIILIHCSTEVVGSKAVVTQLKVDAPNGVEEESTETLPSVSNVGGLGSRAEHLECLAVVSTEELHIGLPELGTSSLQRIEEKEGGR